MDICSSISVRSPYTVADILNRNQWAGDSHTLPSDLWGTSILHFSKTRFNAVSIRLPVIDPITSLGPEVLTNVHDTLHFSRALGCNGPTFRCNMFIDPDH